MNGIITTTTGGGLVTQQGHTTLTGDVYITTTTNEHINLREAIQRLEKRVVYLEEQLAIKEIMEL